MGADMRIQPVAAWAGVDPLVAKLNPSSSGRASAPSIGPRRGFFGMEAECQTNRPALSHFQITEGPPGDRSPVRPEDVRGLGRFAVTSERPGEPARSVPVTVLDRVAEPLLVAGAESLPIDICIGGA